MRLTISPFQSSVSGPNYLVRVQVDAAESTLVLATGDPDTSQYDNPRVVIA